MSIGCVGGGAAPQLQTAWTRAEAACAARHRGDAYYELLAPAPPRPGDATSAAAGATNEPGTGDGAPTASSPAPGFILYM